MNRFRCEYAQLLDLRFRLGAHKAHFVFQLDGAVFHTNQHDHADVVIKPRIDNNRLQRRVFVAGRRGDFGNDFFQNVFHTDAAFGGTLYRADGIDADDVFDFLFHAFGVGGGQVDFVQNRHDFHAQINRGVAVRHGLRFHALRCVNDQKRAFAGGQRTGNFVRKVDVSRRVNQVELIHLSVACFVVERGGLRFDGDAALFFDVHGVEHLRTHFAQIQAAAVLDEAVGKRRFAVVDVGNDGEVSDIFHIVILKDKQ